VLLMIWAVQSLLSAAEFKLTNGDIIRGETASVDAEGIVIRREIGGFSDRISWARLTQDTLKMLLQDPEAKKFAEPFIEVPIEIKKEKEKKKEIIIKEPPRPERPVQKSFFAGLLTPAGFMVLGIIFFANLYSAFHIANFRGRPVALVVGTSVILPIIGPILFLSMPSTDAAMAPPTETAAPVNTDVVSAETKVAGMQSNLGLAAHQKGGPKQDSSAQVYKRTEVTMDRRFFETKFAGYFRMVPENPDMVLVVKTPKQEYVARRISRISSNEVHLQLLRGNTEVGVPFGEISEVQVRHKDAK
ncbi:MAG TPA: hypothetical protein VHL50_01930, partial [Pyrinomonadaceae bacterium]|nr:hypothetical protein [Pyrinomonadaceae bacterium]